MYGVCIGKRHKLKYNSDMLNVGWVAKIEWIKIKKNYMFWDNYSVFTSSGVLIQQASPVASRSPLCRRMQALKTQDCCKVRIDRHSSLNYVISSILVYKLESPCMNFKNQTFVFFSWYFHNRNNQKSVQLESENTFFSVQHSTLYWPYPERLKRGVAPVDCCNWGEWRTNERKNLFWLVR